ncbi:hypothetical protein LCGC14_1161960 [marine sediment metagenome]|uniref:Uncharacterized protein n=1 Tax=marine sediment metagenome TaxID=412755 RepID=A0A0F9MFC5_9ZZZZ
MVTPTKECIYAPSRIRPTIEVDSDEVTQVQDIPVSFNADGKSNPVPTTTYISYSKDKGGNLILNSFGRFIKKQEANETTTL